MPYLNDKYYRAADPPIPKNTPSRICCPRCLTNEYEWLMKDDNTGEYICCSWCSTQVAWDDESLWEEEDGYGN